MCARLLWKVATTRKIRCDFRHFPFNDDDDDVQLLFCCCCSSTWYLLVFFSLSFCFFFWFLNAVVCVYFLLLLHICVHKNWRACTSLTPNSLIIIILFPFFALTFVLFISFALTHCERTQFTIQRIFQSSDLGSCYLLPFMVVAALMLLSTVLSITFFSFIFFFSCCSCFVCVFDIVLLWKSLECTRNIYFRVRSPSLAGTLCWIHKKETRCERKIIITIIKLVEKDFEWDESEKNGVLHKSGGAGMKMNKWAQT